MNLKLTQKAKEEIDKLKASEISSINFSKMRLGIGPYTTEELEIEITELKEPKIETDIAEPYQETIDGESQFFISSTFINDEVIEKFSVREVGIYAISNTDNKEYLYSYCIVALTDTAIAIILDKSIPQYIPISVNTKLSNIDQVNIAIVNDVLVVHQDEFKRYKVDIKEYINEEDTKIKTSIIEQDVAIRTYINEQDAVMKTYVDEKDTAMKTYVDEQDAVMKTYIDEQDTAIETYVDEKDILVKTYVDEQNVLITKYVTEQDILVKTYSDEQDVLVKTYVDKQDKSILNNIVNQDEFIAYKEEVEDRLSHIISFITADTPKTLILTISGYSNRSLTLQTGWYYLEMQGGAGGDFNSSNKGGYGARGHRSFFLNNSNNAYFGSGAKGESGSYKASSVMLPDRKSVV